MKRTDLISTRIAVFGQGFRVEIIPSFSGGWMVDLYPDINDSISERVGTYFLNKVYGNKVRDWNSISATKTAVERAIERTEARWDGWPT